ncbi:MAG TPA: hypothetical protein VFB00_05280 [Terriglobales bacterium]|nr:hypothetical protein [Terriglobales bacterium]
MGLQPAPKDSALKTGPSSPAQTDRRDLALLVLLAAAAILVHGYHPFIEDAEIYAPGIEKLLNPSLFPFNDAFFTSHARLTLFPNLIAATVRLTRLPLEWALLAWHFACLYCMLLACWKLARLCFGATRAAWGSTVLLACLLTIPVAGTALYIMDQYVNPRSFFAASALWIILKTIERKYWTAALWVGLTGLVHPLMAAFSLAFATALVVTRRMERLFPEVALVAIPLGLFPPVTSAYRQVLDSHSYFFPLRWAWYEWLGAIAPLAILWWFGEVARYRRLAALKTLGRATVLFTAGFIFAGLAITIPPQFMRFAELQPMRCLQLTYMLLALISGGLLAEFALGAKLWRWVALFLPLCSGMFYAQRQLFPATAHLELPGRRSGNAWLQAFEWIRTNTPSDAYFALDPDHMRLPGEDQHGFRAIARRSMLADRVKDSGAVTMFPALASQWLEQVNAQQNWKRFAADDFQRLHQTFGVTWVVLQAPGPGGMDCPYRNASLLVCRLATQREYAESQ